MKRLLTLLIIMMFIFTFGGCNNEKPYAGSEYFPEFPIPKEAKLVEQKEDGYEKYLYNAQGGNQGIRDDYYSIIQNWGWKERIDLRMGTAHVFEKDGKLVSITVHGSSEGDFFTISNVELDN